MNMHLGNRWRYLLATTMAAGAAVATAQTTPAGDDGEIYELSAFEVRAAEDFGYRAINTMTATRIGVSLQQVPLSVQVVTEEFVEDLGLASFADSLRYVSSAVGDSLSPQGEAGNATIRGFPTAWTLRNGFRRYRAMAIENADRVEIVKGPVSVFFGQAAPGGITNIITKRPEFFNNGSVKATYGSYDYKKAALDYNLVLVDNVLAARLYTSYEDREDWKDFEWKEATYISPSIKWRPTKTTEIIFEYEYLSSDENKAGSAIYINQTALDSYLNPPSEILNGLYKGDLALMQRIWRSTNVSQWEQDYNNKKVNLPIPSEAARYAPEMSPSGWAWNGNGPDAFIEYDSKDYTLEIKQRVTDWFELRAAGNYSDSSSLDVRFHSADRPYPDSEPVIDLIRGNAGGWQANELLSLQTDALFRFNLGPTKHTILVGAERVDDEFQSATNNFDYNLAEGIITPSPDPYGFPRTMQQMFQRYYPFFDPVQPSAGMVFNGVNAISVDQENTRKGYYVNHQGEFFNGRLNTMFGARREKFTSESVGAAPTEYEDDVFMGGFSLKVIEGLNFFASFSQSFEPNRPPNDKNIQGAGVLPGEQQQLGPRSGEGIDIGFKSALWDNKLSGTISYFNLQQEANVRRDDEKTNSDPRNLDDDSTNNVTWFRNAGRTESEGLEVELVYSPTPNYQLVAAFSWMWTAALVEDPGLPPDHGLFDRRNQNSPEYKFTLWNKYVFTEGRLAGFEIGLGGRYIDDHFPRTGLGTTQLLVNEESLVFDGLLAYKTTIGGYETRFALQLENLLDEVYQEGHTAAGDPFKANFSVTVNF